MAEHERGIEPHASTDGKLPSPQTEGSGPAPRPAPEYGEYAPDGWSWSPDGETSATAAGPAEAVTGDRPAGFRDAEASAAAAAPSVAAPSVSAYAGSASPAPARSGRLPGVPHNLGAAPQAAGGAPSAGSAPSAGGAPSAGAPGQAHYRASAPAPSRGTATGAQPLRRGDRIATILLLVLGAFGALYSATTLQQLPASLSMLASALDITDFVVPDAIPTLGTVGGLLVLAVYALAVVLSIQRLRRGSLSLLGALAAAAIAFLITFAFTAFALNQAPELVQHLADPDAMTKLLDYLGGLEGARQHAALHPLRR